VEASATAPGGGTTRIGKYEIVDVLGRGGMGVVYRGIDKHIGREVAIKTLTEGFAGDPTMLERFYEEGRRTGRLNHPNIVTVYDLGDDNGTPYIVMECVAGETLEAILRSGRTLPLADALQIVVEVCTALGYAHLNKVIHRDVKPANVFVQPDGKTKLLDFGIARLEKREKDQNLTRTGHLIGTVAYMAPERLRGDPLDGRSDLFSAGVMLYQVVAGQRPFDGPDNILMQRILSEPAPPLRSVRPDCPPALEQIVSRALAKSPDERYSSGEEMAADLSAVIADLRHGQADELMLEAQNLAAAQDYTHARTVLHQLLKIDSKHAAARDLLTEVHHYFALRKREERVSEVLHEAEEYFAKKQYEQALATLEGNEELLASHPDFARLREEAKCAKQRQDRIGEQLSLVEAARRRGDYATAIAAAQKALQMDESNSRIFALCSLLAKEAEQAQRAVQVRTLLNAARGEIGSRHYRQALEVLRQVEQLDPTNSELMLLQQDVNSGMEQARQRETVARLEERVALASNTEEIRQVAQALQEAMVAMPSESALYRLNAQVERMARDQENRRIVEEAVRACRDLSPRAALEVVQRTRMRLPADEQLLTLEALLSDRLHQQSVDERRADYLARSRQALSQQQYSEAVRILDFCQAEGIGSSEVLSLLEFARNEEKDHRQQDRLRNHLAKAQELLAAGDYDAAIAFLQQSLEQGEDPALRMLLEQASSGREAQQQQVSTALAAAARLHGSGKLDEALQFLQMQPAEILRTALVQAALESLDEERQQAVFRTLGRAYATLKDDPAKGAALQRKAAAAATDHRFTTALGDALRARQNAAADGAVDNAVKQARILRTNRDLPAAEAMLLSVVKLLPFAAVPLQASWEQARKKFSTSSQLSVLRLPLQKDRAPQGKTAKM
jgi:serine/threonine-protein kinase